MKVLRKARGRRTFALYIDMMIKKALREMGIHILKKEEVAK